MKLMNLEEYRMTYFTEHSRPSRRQVIRWIQQGELSGRSIGKQYFVTVQEKRSNDSFDVNQFLRRMR